MQRKLPSLLALLCAMGFFGGTKVILATVVSDQVRGAVVMAQTGGSAMGTESGTSYDTSGEMSKTSMSRNVKSHHPDAKAHSFRGAVTAVDAVARSVTVKAKGGDMTFTWDDKTTISPKGKTAGDVTVGTDVTVSYKLYGDAKTATKISIHAPKGVDGTGGGLECRCTDVTYSQTCCSNH